MQRHHVHARAVRPVRERLPRPADLRRARQEHEDVALDLLPAQAPHRARDEVLEPVLPRRVLRREVLDGDLEAPPLGPERPGAEVAGHGRGVEGRRHRDELQVGARGALEAPQQREREIALQVALVELVEHDRADAGERGRREQPAREEPLGHVADPRPGPRDLLEPHLPADRLARALSQLLRHAARREPRGEPARLEHHHLASAGEAGLVQRARDAGRLPGAGGRLDDRAGPGAERRHEVGQERVDGEGLQGHRRVLLHRGGKEHPDAGALCSLEDGSAEEVAWGAVAR